MELEKYWKAFGDGHFNKADLWKVFGRRAGFPHQEWIDSLGVEHEPGIIPSKGPRGGRGWRLSSESVKKMKAKEAREAKTAERAAEVISNVQLKLGSLRYEAGKIKWVYAPEVIIPGQIDRRYAKTRYRSVSLCEPFIASWPVSISATKLQVNLDEIYCRVRELAKRQQNHLKRELAALEAAMATFE